MEQSLKLEKNSSEVKKLFSNLDLKKLFLPLMLEQFLEYFVGLADSIMVAHIGESSVSGVSLVDFIMALLISVFVALSTGGAVITGQYLGKNENKNANEAATQLMWFVGLVSVVIMGLVYVGKPLILNGLFGNITPAVHREADKYLMLTGGSIPFLALYNAGAALFRTSGNSKLPMKIMLFMNISNAVGNAVLIYGFHLGIEGVAIPTLASRVLSALIIIVLVVNEKNTIFVKRTLKHKFDTVMIKRILSIGIPYGIESGLFFLGRIVVLSLISIFGTPSIAANAVSQTIVMFQVLPGIAMGVGLTVVVARCMGIDDIEQAKYYTKKIIGLMYIAHIVSTSIIILLLPLIFKIYNLSNEATFMALRNVWWHGIVMVLIWPLAYSLPSTFRAAGDAKFPMYVSTLSMFFCRIVLAYILGIYFDMGMFGTWVAMFVDWVVKAVIFIKRYINEKWTKFSVIS